MVSVALQASYSDATGRGRPSSGPGTLVVLLVFLGFRLFSLVFLCFSLFFLGFPWFSESLVYTTSLVLLGFNGRQDACVANGMLV